MKIKYTGMELKLHRHGIRIALASVFGAMLTATPLVSDSALANGIVMGKVFWFHLSMALMAIGTIVTIGFGGKKSVSFSLPDGLLLLFAGVTLATYDWQLGPEPEKLLFRGQLIVLWFLLRYFLTEVPCLKFFFLFILMLTGLAEAVWGMQQLHGHAYSHHSLFRLTGSFFNPGPYSGYLAVVLPVCLWTALRFQKGMRYFGWVCVGAILVVLPAGMSRSAWVAAIVACGWVYWMERIGWEKTKAVYIRYKNAAIPFFVIVTILAGCTVMGLYGLKRDSADGRRLMWKVTGKAIAGQPLAGTGLGSFPAAYIEAQGEYFTTRTATDQEKQVAGCPEYAFNEYLQIGLEQGIGGLIVFVLWLGSMGYYGIRNRQNGAVGGVFALAVFAVSSYPLQLPSFWVVLVFLGAICVTGNDTHTAPSREGRRYYRALLAKGGITIMALAGILFFQVQKGQYKVYKRWGRMQMFYNNKAYESVIEDYKDLHGKLKHKPEFLFEEAQCLNKTGQYTEAIQLLERAKRLSGDPMIRYMIAKNRQALGDYREAERELLHAIEILPERLYPYYLLAKLYAEPAFYQADKFRVAAEAVLAKEPKVESTAIREMRGEIKKMVEKGDAD
ncbi:O-antigen ligase family protein [uncultured Parabacteroides sp.]|uniref:O-antigen ligase family protein n=1 Tax=uncultured Parabacteroides sp. TaxID=512312 RepID=UPI0026161340|nr:O-antigen ligase family protein [uncultured Parabacteroides sp.]